MLQQQLTECQAHCGPCAEVDPEPLWQLPAGSHTLFHRSPWKTVRAPSALLHTACGSPGLWHEVQNPVLLGLANKALFQLTPTFLTGKLSLHTPGCSALPALSALLSSEHELYFQSRHRPAGPGSLRQGSLCTAPYLCSHPSRCLGDCPTSTKHPPIPQLPAPPTELRPPSSSTLEAPYAGTSRCPQQEWECSRHSPCLVHLCPPAPRSMLSTHQAPSESLLSANIKELERVILPPQVTKKPDERNKTTVFKHWASGSPEE